MSHLGCIIFPSQGLYRSKCFLLWVVYVHSLFVSCWIWAVRPNRHSKGLVEGLALMHRHRETRHTPDSSIRRHGARYISSFQREIFRSSSACHFVLEDERRGWWNGLNTNDFFWTRIPHEPLARRSQFFMNSTFGSHKNHRLHGFFNNEFHEWGEFFFSMPQAATKENEWKAFHIRRNQKDFIRWACP